MIDLMMEDLGRQGLKRTMKRLLVSIVFFFLLCSPSLAFVSFGNIDSTLEYQDLIISPQGSQMTVFNKSSVGRDEFYIIITGTNFRDSTVYRHRMFVDFLPGYGAITLAMPPYRSNDTIFSIRFDLRKPMEMDVRIR